MNDLIKMTLLLLWVIAAIYAQEDAEEKMRIKATTKHSTTNIKIDTTGGVKPSQLNVW